jgi:argininosuccinate lyase
MTKGNKNKVWGTRVKKPTSKLLQSINSSIDIDKRLFNEDIDASIAHCEMLSKQKIIKSESAKKIIFGLKKIKIEIQNNKFEFKKEHEDIHLNVEKKDYLKLLEITLDIYIQQDQEMIRL